MTTENRRSAEPVHFYSRGARISADLYLPDAQPPFPAVAVCHGFGSIRKYWVNDIASELAERGIAALIFDYRGFGDSDGPRDRLFPLEQVEDARAAVGFLASLEAVDPHRLGLYGVSFGGAVAAYAAAVDRRVRATVSAVGIADGYTWLKSLRRHWEWLEFEKRLAADRQRRILTGESELVDPGEIVLRDPESAELAAKLDADFPQRSYRLTLESADAIMEFRPIDTVAQISPRAVLFVGVEGDRLTPAEHTRALFERAGDPKGLIMLRGITHHDVYQPDRLRDLIDRAAAFYGENFTSRQ